MMLRKYPILLFILSCCLHVAGQAIDNTLSFKNIPQDKYFRFNYENDVFSTTDQYYTQGINGELVHPDLRRFPLSRLLVRPRFDHTRYGIGVQHNGYTPTSISSDNILYGDRPFAACLFFNTFLIATDTARRQRFSTTLSTGVMGPAAGGMKMQVDIHKALRNIDPHGWQHQLHNDVIINYQVQYEKQLLLYRNNLSLDAGGMVRLGTLSNKVSAGATLVVGRFHSPFSTPSKGKKNQLHIYAYDHPCVNIGAYDATLQGGLFSRTSPYTISARDVNTFTFQNRLGIVVSYRNLYLEYFRSFLSAEFATGKSHEWGGVQVAMGL